MMTGGDLHSAAETSAFRSVHPIAIEICVHLPTRGFDIQRDLQEFRNRLSGLGLAQNGGHYPIDVLFSCLLGIVALIAMWNWPALAKAPAWTPLRKLPDLQKVASSHWLPEVRDEATRAMAALRSPKGRLEGTWKFIPSEGVGEPFEIDHEILGEAPFCRSQLWVWNGGHVQAAASPARPGCARKHVAAILRWQVRGDQSRGVRGHSYVEKSRPQQQIGGHFSRRCRRHGQ
jgi:hypothetical protein